MLVPALLTLAVIGALAATRRSSPPAPPLPPPPPGDRLPPEQGGGTQPDMRVPAPEPDAFETSMFAFYNRLPIPDLLRSYSEWLRKLAAEPRTADLREPRALSRVLYGNLLATESANLVQAIQRAELSRRVVVVPGPLTGPIFRGV